MSKGLGKFQQQLVNIMSEAYDGDGFHYSVHILEQETGASQPQISKALTSLIKRGLATKSVSTESIGDSRWAFDYILVSNQREQDKILEEKKAKRAKEEKLALELGYESRTDWAFATMFK